MYLDLFNIEIFPIISLINVRMRLKLDRYFHMKIVINCLNLRVNLQNDPYGFLH